MAQVVETTIANNVTGMEEISKLINKVGELDSEQKRLAAAMSQVKAAGDKLTKSTHNVASATKAQASAANELRNRLDPMFAAQKRFNQQMDEADRLYEAGVISLKEYTAAQKQARDALRQHAQAVQNGSVSVKNGTNDLDAQSKVFRRNRQAMQMAGMQIGDFATQVTSGTSPVQAFNQQLGQLGYALSTSAKPRLAAVGNFLAGPWSIAVLGATMILGPMIENMLGLGDAAEEAKGATVDIEKAMDYASMSAGQLTEATKLLKEANEDYQKEARQSLTLTLANAKASHESAKAKLAEAEATLAQFEASNVLKGRDSRFLATDVTQQQIEGLRARVESASASLNLEEERFRGAQAEMMHYVATTDSATQAQDALTESLDLTRAMIADGTLTLDEGRVSMNALTRARQSLSEKEREAKKAAQGSAEARRKANEALERAIKLQEQLESAQRAATKYQKEFNKRIQEGLDLGKEKPKTYEQVLADLENIETLEIETPKGLQDILDKNAEVRSSFEAIGNAVANGFKGMITGAQSFGSAMKGIIQSVIDELFRLYVVQQIVGFVKGALGGIFGVPDAKALGGSVSANTPYIVGEKGPELFMPSKSGTIIPNQNLPSGGGGGSTFNISVDARGSTDPEAVRQQVQQGILEAAPSIVAAAQNRTINTLRRPRLAGAL